MDGVPGEVCAATGLACATRRAATIRAVADESNPRRPLPLVIGVLPPLLSSSRSGPPREDHRLHPILSGPRFRWLWLEPIACLENPPHSRKANGEECRRHAEADAYADIRNSIEAPAEAADQVNDWVDQCDRLPNWRQNLDGVEAATQEAQRGDDEKRHDLQLLEPIGPNADDEAKQAERHRGQHQERQHRDRMVEP